MRPIARSLPFLSSSFPRLASARHLALVAFAAGCVSVTPEVMPPPARASAPLLESVAVFGPVYRDRRVAGYETHTENSFASANGTYGNQSWSGTGSAVTTNTVQHVEAFDNRALEERFVRHLEASNVAVRLLPEGRHRFDATIHIDGDTGAGKVAWNVLNTCSGLFLIGSPYLGTSLVTVEVRAYDDDRFVRTYEAEALASWSVPGLWGIAHTVGEARSEAVFVAGDVALAKVVRQIVADAEGGRVTLATP